MNEDRRKMMTAGTKIGAAIGFIAFVVFGIVPAFYFGSFGTVTMLSHLAGGPVEPTTLVRMLIVVGILLAIFCVGAVSMVLGSVFGTVLGYIVDVVTSTGKASPEADKAKAESK